jgi:myo-inositol-1(or 4)-monophosphatase
VLVREAGGKVSDFEGGPFQIASRETLASNGLIHATLLQEFKEIFAGRGLEGLPSPLEYAKNRR